MLVLDTNVISELMKAEPARQVVSWLDGQPAESVWTTSITVFEILYGLNVLPSGKRKQALQDAFHAMLLEDLEHRILEFDHTAAAGAADISAKLHKEGRPIEIRDLLIAGIVSARRGTLVTRNTNHFEITDIRLINPWE